MALMAKKPQKWSRGEVLGAIGAVATLLCFLAALVVVPEFRRVVGLDNATSSVPEATKPETKRPDISVPAGEPKSTASAQTPPQKPAPVIEKPEIESYPKSDVLDQQVKRLIAAKLKVDLGRVTDNARLVKDLHADELDMTELVLSLEDSFDVNIRDIDSVGFVNVKDVVNYVNAHARKKEADAGKASSIRRVDFHDKQNWRRFLHTGMTRSEVGQLFGEPERVWVSGTSEYWNYGRGNERGTIIFHDGSLFLWTEPQN
jgi:acyl carrier protein